MRVESAVRLAMRAARERLKRDGRPAFGACRNLNADLIYSAGKGYIA